MIVKVEFFSAAASAVTPPLGPPLGLSLARSLSPSLSSPYSSTALCFIPVHKPSETRRFTRQPKPINSLREYISINRGSLLIGIPLDARERARMGLYSMILTALPLSLPLL